jgi:DNA-binding MarR family transcriptional regulator
MNGESWESLLTEKGFMRVPRALRLKRAELGITNNEYTILLDYVDYFTFSGTMNPYRHLSEVSGMSERSIKKALASLEKKGFLKREFRKKMNGRTNGVVFSIAPLVRKLKAAMKKSSPTVGEENDTHVREELFTPNTREEFNKREEGKNTSAKNADNSACADESLSEKERMGKKSEACDSIYGRSGETGGPRENAGRNDRSECTAGQIHLAPGDEKSVDEIRCEFSDGEGGPRRPVSGKGSGITSDGEAPETPNVSAGRVPDAGRKGKNAPAGSAYSPTRWYNEVFRELYEAASGQPALTGGREYKSAETYFRRLRELNPEMTSGEIYELAGEGAAFMICSQLEGGIFGWVNRPPDVCLLSSQAQSVDWHLRKIRSDAAIRDGPSGASAEGGGSTSVRLSFIERLREVNHAGEQIDRVYGELRGIENAPRGGGARRALPGPGRVGAKGRGAQAEAAPQGGAKLPRKRPPAKLAKYGTG